MKNTNPGELGTSAHPDANWCRSKELAHAMLAGIPSERLDGLVRDLAAELPDLSFRPDEHAGGLLELCQSAPRVCEAIKLSWRDAHAEVVSAARLVSLEGPSEQCQAIAGQFGPELALLELLTDDCSGGWDVAEWVVDNVQNDDVRRECVALLEAWSGRSDAANPLGAAAEEDPIRVAIFGGHPRDASKMNRRLFDNSVFEVFWNVCDKTHGSPDGKELAAAVAAADAVILVTTMLSHNVMSSVKRFTQLEQVPLLTIKQATDRQLREALTELYPHLALTDR